MFQSFSYKYIAFFSKKLYTERDAIISISAREKQMRISQLKKLAKSQLKGNLLMLFLITLAISVINSAVSVIPVIGQVAIFFVGAILSISLCKMYLDLANSNQAPSFEILLYGADQWKSGAIAFFLQTLYIFLWSLLLIVPGIIKSFAYSMTFYVLAEHPEMSGSDAIKESTRIMKGNKMKLFLLMLSFIGWILLSAITFGIALIYVAPYMSLTMTNFYNEIKGSNTYTAV